MARIIGLGGVFLQLKGDEATLIKWYHDTLNIRATNYGVNLSSTYPTLITFKRNQTNAVLNFIVDDITSMVQLLRQKQVKIVHDIKAYEYGLFAQIEDPFGNVIELFEVFEEAYKEMIEAEEFEYKNNQKNG